MALVNTSRPTTSLTNSARASSGVTWATIATTWASETDTWAGLVSIIDNLSKPKTLGEYTFDEIGTLTIEQAGGAMNDSTFMINTAKPT